MSKKLKVKDIKPGQRVYVKIIDEKQYGGDGSVMFSGWTTIMSCYENGNFDTGEALIVKPREIKRIAKKIAF